MCSSLGNFALSGLIYITGLDELNADIASIFSLSEVCLVKYLPDLYLFIFLARVVSLISTCLSC